MAVGLGALIVLWNLLPHRSGSDRAEPDQWNTFEPPEPPEPPAG
jgi:hypothetical protein